MKKIQFAVGIISAVALAPVTYTIFVLFAMAYGFGVQARQETLVAGGSFLCILALNAILPFYICRKALKNEPLFPALNKVPVYFLVMLLAVLVFIVLQMLYV